MDPWPAYRYTPGHRAKNLGYYGGDAAETTISVAAGETQFYRARCVSDGRFMAVVTQRIQLVPVSRSEALDELASMRTAR